MSVIADLDQALSWFSCISLCSCHIGNHSIASMYCHYYCGLPAQPVDRRLLCSTTRFSPCKSYSKARWRSKMLYLFEQGHLVTKLVCLKGEKLQQSWIFTSNYLQASKTTSYMQIKKQPDCCMVTVVSFYLKTQGKEVHQGYVSMLSGQYIPLSLCLCSPYNIY